MKLAARFTDLPARMLSVAIAAPLVILAIWVGGLFYDVLIGTIIVLGMYEWLRLHQNPPSIVCEGINFIALVLIWWMSSLGYYGFACLILVAIGGFSHAIYERAKLENSSWISFGLPYLGGAMIALMAIGNDSSNLGRNTIFFLLFTVWAADTGAYLFGRILGGPKLAPIISPSKTWAGLFGALAGATSIGWLFQQHVTIGGPITVLVLAGLMGLAAQLGDLFESYVKRRAGVKDSGRILPGHGGILDRIDGLIIAAMVLVLWHFARGLLFGPYVA